MAAEPLVRLCRHLDRSLLQTSTVQNAVWSVSNNRNINAVYTRGDDLSLVVELKRLLSALTGQAITPYFIEYEQYGDNYWSFRPAYLYLEDSYSVKKEGAVCVVFTDTTGKVIRQLMAPTRRLPDTFKLEVRMFLNGCASGKYFVRVYCDNRIQKQWEIKL